jgi:hypothetical protein
VGPSVSAFHGAFCFVDALTFWMHARVSCVVPYCLVTVKPLDRADSVFIELRHVKGRFILPELILGRDGSDKPRS